MVFLPHRGPAERPRQLLRLSVVGAAMCLLPLAHATAARDDEHSATAHQAVTPAAARRSAADKAAAVKTISAAVLPAPATALPLRRQWPMRDQWTCKSPASLRPPPSAWTISTTPPTMALSSPSSVGIHLYGASWWEPTVRPLLTSMLSSSLPPRRRPRLHSRRWGHAPPLRLRPPSPSPSGATGV